MQSKEQKIEQIIALMRGEITPGDLNQNLMIKIGYEEDNIYLLNGVMVEKDKFDIALKKSHASKWHVTYGGDHKDGEE